MILPLISWAVFRSRKPRASGDDPPPSDHQHPLQERKPRVSGDDPDSPDAWMTLKV